AETAQHPFQAASCQRALHRLPGRGRLPAELGTDSFSRHTLSLGRATDAAPTAVSQGTFPAAALAPQTRSTGIPALAASGLPAPGRAGVVLACRLSSREQSAVSAM